MIKTYSNASYNKAAKQNSILLQVNKLSTINSRSIRSSDYVLGEKKDTRKEKHR